MLLLIDDAHIEDIKRIYDKYPVDGVTTNPTILKKVGGDPMEILKEIRAFLPEGDQLHAQVVSGTTEGMVKEAHYLVEQLGEDLFVKIPAVDAGIKAIKILSAEGIRTTATAIYSPTQAFMAAKAGALWLAPYINRLDNMGADGVNIALRIHDAITAAGLKAQVVGASFKNSEQIMRLAEYGVASATAAPDVLENMVKNAGAIQAVKDFTADFYTMVGGEKTMLDF